MFKIVLLTRRVYLFTLDTAIKANIRKEKAIITANTKAIKVIDALQMQMEKLAVRIQDLEDKAESDILIAQMQVTADYNSLTNLKDNV